MLFTLNQNKIFYVRGALAALAVLLMGAFTNSAPALAEMVVEQNRIYIGNDYKVFTLKPGERRKCRQACAKDRRCQAWTFVKPGGGSAGECRLKRDIKLSFKNSCCVSGKKQDDFRTGANTKAKRARVKFCDNWAAQSSKLNDINEKRNCGYRGRAWHSNETRHFRRCMGLKRKDLANEQAGQKRAVNICLAELEYAKKTRCDHYARIAVTQNASRVKAGCDVRNNNRWSNRYKDHYSFCLDARKKLIADEQEARETRLRRCHAVDRQQSGPCHDYAQTAITQFRRNIQKGCDLHGPRWHNNYLRHVSFCRQAGPKQRKAEFNRRRLTLKTCKLFGKFGIQWR